MARILKRDVIKWVAENLKGKYRVIRNDNYDGWDVQNLETAQYYPWEYIKDIIGWAKTEASK